MIKLFLDDKYTDNKLWLFDIIDNAASWAVVNVENESPCQRHGHAMVFSANHIMLYGGTLKNEPLNDLWVLPTYRFKQQWEKIRIEGFTLLTNPQFVKKLDEERNFILIGDRSGLMEFSTLKLQSNDSAWLISSFSNSLSCSTLKSQRLNYAVSTGPFVFISYDCNVESEIKPYLCIYSTTSNKFYDPITLESSIQSMWIVLKIDSAVEFGITIYGCSGLKGFESIQELDLIKMSTTDFIEELKDFVSTKISTAEWISQKKKSKIEKLSHYSLLGRPMTVSKEDLDYFPKRLSINYDADLIKTILHTLLFFPEFYYDNPPTLSFRKEEILTVISLAKEVLKMTSMVLNIKPPLKVFGSLNGNYKDLMGLFTLYNKPAEHEGDIERFQYLFLGDCFFGNAFSLETIYLLLALKVSQYFNLLR